MKLQIFLDTSLKINQKNMAMYKYFLQISTFSYVFNTHDCKNSIAVQLNPKLCVTWTHANSILNNDLSLTVIFEFDIG